MTENMKQFLEAVSRDEALTAKVGNLGKEELIAMAKGMGILLAEADFSEPSGELDDDELDAVAGGGPDVSCVCPVGGGGTKDNNDKACVCIACGAGYTKSGRDRCVCGFAGYGYDS